MIDENLRGKKKMNGRDDEWIIAVLILLCVWLFEILILCSVGIGKPLTM